MVNTNLILQKELLKKYGVSNYTIENNTIIINDDLELYQEEFHKDFLKGVIINGKLNLRTLEDDFPENFLKDAIFNEKYELESYNYDIFFSIEKGEYVKEEKWLHGFGSLGGWAVKHNYELEKKKRLYSA